MTEQLGVTLFKIAFWIYLASTICYVAHFINKQKGIGKLGTSLLVAGLVAHTASIAIITIAIGRLPFLNLYEYLLSFTWGAMVVYLVLELILKNRALGGFAAPLITAFVFFNYRLPSNITDNVMPALRSGWRVPHIASAILAYAAFTLAFVLAILYLVRNSAEGAEKSFWTARLPVLKVLDQTIYRTIAFGFLMQTILVITGAIWAQFAWGRYWGWDPKETWAFITWLIYAAYLHTRLTLGWRGRKSAIVVIIGFVAVIFTMFGVTYFLTGLHSYGS
jgi:cytochrome c-type biogenesis protein CcsB